MLFQFIKKKIDYNLKSTVRGILFIVVISITSCKSYRLTGRKFQGANQEKIVTIDFLNDTLCKVTQEFQCNKIPDKYRKVSFKSSYKVRKINIQTYNNSYKPIKTKFDALIISNLECVDCKRYIEIPNYRNLNCTKDSIDKRLKGIVKIGLIYNLVNDTIILDKHYIYFGNLKLKPKD